MRGEPLQNHRMVGVGRDLCGSSSPTLLPKQGHHLHPILPRSSPTDYMDLHQQTACPSVQEPWVGDGNTLWLLESSQISWNGKDVEGSLTAKWKIIPRKVQWINMARAPQSIIQRVTISNMMDYSLWWHSQVMNGKLHNPPLNERLSLTAQTHRQKPGLSQLSLQTPRSN